MRGRSRRQKDVICDVISVASGNGVWLTLDELAKLTHYPPASISSQLRKLRQEDYVLDKRMRALSDESGGVIWEYQLRRA